MSSTYSTQHAATKPPRDLQEVGLAEVSQWQCDKALIDALPSAVLVLDRQGRVRHANRVARQWLDGALLGESWRDIYQRELSQALEHGALVNKEQRLLNISTQSLSQQAGQVVLLSDMTESHRLQRIAERHSRLATMGEMTARLAHQIRTPIATAVLYLTQLQGATHDDARRQRYIEKSLSRLEHVEHMVRDMLMFAHGAQIDAETLHIGTLIDDLCVQLKPLIESVGASYRIDCSSNLKLVANRVGLVTALLNICTNAIENKGQQLQLDIKVIERKDCMLIDISDNGSGVPAELRERIFQPFFTTRSDGTGLGLSVVQSIVKAHRGSVTMGDSAMGGSTFSITLPRPDTETPLKSPVAARAA